MSISDDDLDRLFRAANPAPPEEFASLRAKDISLRENIIRGTATPARTRRRSWAWAGATTAVASLVVVTIVVVSVLLPSQQALALTPPPLVYSNAQPLAEVVDDARDALARPGGPDQESRVETLSWGWNIDMAEQSVEVVPQYATFTWSPEAGSSSVVVAGESLWDDDDRPEGVADSPYEPGQVISEVSTPPGEFIAPPAVLELDGADRPQLAAALESLGAPANASSGQLLVAIGQLLSFWTLTDAQHGLLIDMLVDAGGVTVLGETRDREGRPVVGLRVSDDGSPYRDTVLISMATGRIVGVENERTEPLDFIPAGVVGYTLWDLPRR
ncbi:hypothetical protein [Microbacterium sp. LWH13-1.2]|uniref:hypothetical protein n=1 Tax=Microbacterium sp. LWH13-1.2 TaxID=3135260 RepID=UPI003139BBE4